MHCSMHGSYYLTLYIHESDSNLNLHCMSPAANIYTLIIHHVLFMSIQTTYACMHAACIHALQGFVRGGGGGGVGELPPPQMPNVGLKATPISWSFPQNLFFLEVLMMQSTCSKKFALPLLRLLILYWS